MRRKRAPQRTCAGCGQVSGKREMVRLVRTSEGAVEIDETGKRPGRGTYLCRQRSCWQLALQKRRLEHALKLAHSLTQENLAQLAAYQETLAQESD